jgi:hypothetical protein
MRIRNAFLFLGVLLTIGLLIITDPDLGLVQNLGVGAGTITTFVFVLKGVLGSLLLHINRKAMFDYAIADFRVLGETANDTPQGAGLYAIALAIMTLAFAVVIVGSFSL